MTHFLEHQLPIHVQQDVHALLTTYIGQPKTPETVIDIQYSLIRLAKSHGYFIDSQTLDISTYDAESTDIAEYQELISAISTIPLEHFRARRYI